MPRMILVDDLIRELQEIRKIHGNTPVYLREVFWGTKALAKDAEYRLVESVKATPWKVHVATDGMVAIMTDSEPPITVNAKLDSKERAEFIVAEHNKRFPQVKPT